MTTEERKTRLEELEMELARHRAEEIFLVERIEFLKSRNNKGATANYTMVRAGLVGNGTMTSDEVMEFIEVCGIDTGDGWVVAAILAGNPIHVDGVDVMFRQE